MVLPDLDDRRVGIHSSRRGSRGGGCWCRWVLQRMGSSSGGSRRRGRYPGLVDLDHLSEDFPWKKVDPDLLLVVFDSDVYLTPTPRKALVKDVVRN